MPIIIITDPNSLSLILCSFRKNQFKIIVIELIRENTSTYKKPHTVIITYLPENINLDLFPKAYYSYHYNNQAV